MNAVQVLFLDAGRRGVYPSAGWIFPVYICGSG